MNKIKKQICSILLAIGVVLSQPNLIFNSYASVIAESSKATTPPSNDPIVKISSDVPSIIYANTTYTATVTITNKSNVKLETCVLDLTPPGTIMILDGGLSQDLGDLEPNSTKSAAIKFRTADAISSTYQSIDATLKYIYTDVGGSKLNGTATEKIAMTSEIHEPASDKPGSNPEPMIQIGKSVTPSLIRAHGVYTVTLWIKNLGNTTLQSPLANFTSSESIMLLDNSSSQILNDILPGETVNISIKFKATDKITSSTQNIDMELKYLYESDTIGTKAKASANEKIIMQSQISKTEEETTAQVAQPRVQILRNEISGNISANDELNLNIAVNNIGETMIENVIATVNTSDALMLIDNTTSFMLPNIGAYKNNYFTIKLKALEEIPSAAQYLNVEVKYNYLKGKTLTEATATEKILIPANKTEKVDKKDPPAAATPNLIVTGYDFGSEQVAAGTSFDLDLKFKNMNNSIPVENVVMSLETGEGISIVSSSNTFFYSGVPAGGEKSEKISISALPTAKTGSAKIDVNFKYEYISKETRTSVTASEKISIPIYQLDRFEVEKNIQQSDPPTVGNETYASVSYVNKGKSPAYNVQAEIIGDSVVPLIKLQTIGNVEAGANGKINFVVTPQAEGKCDFTIKITYENENMESKSKEVPFSLDVIAPVIEDPSLSTMNEVQVEPPKNNNLLIIGGVGAVVCICAILLYLRAKKKKKAKNLKLQTIVWEDEALVPTDNTPKQEEPNEKA